MATLPILTITLNPALDVTTETERLEPVRKLRCSTPRYDAGGGGVNVSRAIKELGGESRAFVVLGGPTGEQYLEILRTAGIDTVVFRIAQNTRFSLTTMETATGQHYRFVLPGPHFNASEARQVERAVGDALGCGPRFVVVSGSLPPGLASDFYARIVRQARVSGVRAIIDTSGLPLTEALLERPFCVRVNHHEAREAMGGGEFVLAAHAFVHQVIDRGQADVAIVTIGEQGAIVGDRQGVVHLAPPQITVRSSVGAGDSFVAALTLGFAAGWPAEKAARYGVAAGAAAMTSEATELCKRDDVERLFASMSHAAAA